MNLDDQKKLKFDRRLENRRGWLQPGEREAHLEALPDATDKIHDGSEEDAAEAPAAEATPVAKSIAPSDTQPTPQPTPPPSTPEGGFGGA